MTAYFRPYTLNAALDWLGEHQGRVAAGCTDLFAATSQQTPQAATLDITAIEGLSGITSDAGGWRIAAGTTWSALRAVPLSVAFDGLKLAAAEVGSVQIQNAGTIGGNICNASPAADGMPALLTLDAQVELASTRGQRIMPLSDFVTGPRQTVLMPDELLTAVLIPPQSGQGSFYKLGARKYLVISIAMAAARVVVNDGLISEAALAVGSCAPVAKRLTTLENALVGTASSSALALVTDILIAPDISPIGDIRADKTYRQIAAIEVVRRALKLALEAGK